MVELTLKPESEVSLPVLRQPCSCYVAVALGAACTAKISSHTTLMLRLVMARREAQEAIRSLSSCQVPCVSVGTSSCNAAQAEQWVFGYRGGQHLCLEG